jgi:hypothetical protein
LKIWISKITAETATSPQQRLIGRESTIVPGSEDTVTGAADGGTAGAGMLISGCVFFIFTDEGAGGSGNTVMRAVSFFGPIDGDAAGIGADCAVGASGVFAVADAGGGMNFGGWTGLLGAGGINGFEMGGGVVPAAGGLLGESGALVGGREGNVMRTVSRASVGFAAGGGVTAMRTVSFFGSVGSDMRQSKFPYLRMPKTGTLVTV